MSRTSVDLTKQIKAANDIVDVIGSYCKLVKAGRGWKCVCPFHNDTNPSMTIDKAHQNYKCWACGAHGDVYTFIEKYDRVGFQEARTILAKRAGIVIAEATPQDNHKSRLLEVMSWAQTLYHREFLDGQRATEARAYIRSRNISSESVRNFGIGWAPGDYGWLERAAASDGISQELLIEVGLLGKRDDGGGVWDKFRERVMFPIRDIQGRTIAFGGRILPTNPLKDRLPKYYNTSDTVLFNKSDNVFGIDRARQTAHQVGFLALVEGYTDVIMCHQSGIQNVVAALGTGFNERHIAQLRKHCGGKVVMAFDADGPGQSAMDKALEFFVADDLEMAVATLPKGKDPAELLQEADGVDLFKDALNEAVDALDFKLNRLLASEPPTVEGTRKMLDAVLAVLAMAPPVPNQATQMKRELMLTRLSRRLGIEIGTIKQSLRSLQARNKSPHRDEPVAVAAVPVVSQTAILERQLIQLLLAEPVLVPNAYGQVDPLTITHTGIRRLIVELFVLHETGNHADLDGLRVRLTDRPDLFESAMKLADVGRSIPDRPVYLIKVIDGFAGHKKAAETKRVKEQLLSVGDDEEAAKELLRKLQGS